MQKKILIAVDGSIHSQNALHYAASVFKSEPEVNFCLLNIQLPVSQYLVDDSRTDPEVYAELDKMLRRNAERTQDLLSTDKARLVQLGVEEHRIKTVSQQRMLGQAKDILEYAHRHLYDAIVLGRRGISRAQKLFMGSISAKLLEHGASIPIWVVDGDIKLEKMLVALDASDESMDLVDYLATTIERHPSVKITVFHVQLDPVSDNANQEEVSPALARLIVKSEERWRSHFWPEALRRFKAAGINQDRVSLLSTLRKGRIAKMILAEADSGKYDTVVVGRSGSGKAFYFGRVARYVSERITERALWLIG